jgi:hypothetical protein
MAHQMTQVYLFGDQTHDVNAKLRSLLLSKNNPTLTSFFERVYFALRTEIGHLPLRERESFPRFSSIFDLLSRQRESALNPALEGALTCAYQLGYFIR